MQEKDIICGIDEAGRGPLAGPVCAASVIFRNEDSAFYLKDSGYLRDSKKMSQKMRDEAFSEIIKHAFFAIGWASNLEIDRINILQASLLAMRRSFSHLYRMLQKEKPNILTRLKIIVDGNFLPKFEEDVFGVAIIKADAKVCEVMASSILAKVARDAMMCRCHKAYPFWRYDRHKGYPTKAHKDAIKKYGISPIQRRSFKF